MSGPKVFRIVTREEIIAICQNHLARLDAAIAEWWRTGAHAGTVAAADMSAVTARRDALRQLLAEDRFVELQKQVPAEIAFLAGDAQTRIETAAAAAVEARQARRRTLRTARMLADALGNSIPADLRHALAGGDGADMEAAIARAFALLSPPTVVAGPTDRQRALAQELGAGEQRASLADWVARQPSAGNEETVLRIDHHLAELVARDGAEAAAAFEARAVAVADAGPERRALLADSLLIDLAAAVRTSRDRAAVMAKLAELGAEAARVDTPAAKVLRGDIEAALASRDVAAAPALIARATALVADELRAMAAAARRRAILQALAGLGYEVTEGMATAWVQAGKIVLRKAASPNYGVELGGGAEADRLQVRAVAFGAADAARDAARDRDMETIWCGEFARLQELVGKAGGAVTIEKALPAGAVPLKIIAADLSLPVEAVTRPGLRTMRLDR